jgi:gamma-D-glutamyl-L-lysine dipeptidyl-peptidase
MTDYGICDLSVIPVRKEPSEKSEMVNQLLFGDTVYLKDIKNQWCFIISSHDKYEGWIDIKQINTISKLEFETINNETPYFLSELFGAASISNQKTINLVMGSRMPRYKNDSCKIENILYQVSGKFRSTSEIKSENTILELANSYLGTPYLWGGRSPFGIDCSGFVQIIFRMIGVNLQRDASQQVNSGKTVDFIENALPGDLAFFDNEEDRIIHVGILQSKDKIVHASGEVRTDRIDHHGIYNEKELKYTHKLRIIKRLI